MTELVIFFESARSLFSLTLKVFVTHHCIENIQKSDKKDSPNVIHKSTQCHWHGWLEIG
jgi:hypothetical protein